MVDFVGILKKAIDAQNNMTPHVRKRIYKRAIEALEQQFAVATVPQAIADEQKKNLQNAIAIVEEEYSVRDKKLCSSGIEGNSKNIVEDDEHTQNSHLSQSGAFSRGKAERKQEGATNSKDHTSLDKSSVFVLPNAEPVNMEAYSVPEHVGGSRLKTFPSSVSSQGDNPHIISHIFSQAVRRANRLSIRRRIVISVAALFSFFVLTVGVCIVGGRVFLSSDYQALGENLQVSHALPKALSTHRKLTKRLLEDGSEIDVGLNQKADSLNEAGTSKIVASNSERSGEAIFYQTRTNYEAEKVATGNAHWKLIKESRVKGAPEELAIQGDITIPDEGLSLRLILRRNTDLSFPAAYIMDLIFILSDKFSGQAISSVQALTFKASEQSIGQALTKTVTAKIGNDFFLIALSGNHPLLDRNLQLMRELDWIRLVLTDKNGRINELTFTKGQTGKSIFNEVIGEWLTQPNKRTENKQTVLGQKK
ncbi:hypothetical protein [Bartonella rattaustraliani]|uniref:hypothetical protein n=1 Tax=Bartonella rattaustraliani TaxID=481139 RepID=UPI0002DFB4EC|nr:hypothetical protein [Bartonella rattaustraliani]